MPITWLFSRRGKLIRKPDLLGKAAIKMRTRAGSETRIANKNSLGITGSNVAS